MYDIIFLEVFKQKIRIVFPSIFIFRKTNNYFVKPVYERQKSMKKPKAPKRCAALILRINLPLILLSLITLLLSYLIEREDAPIQALLFHRGAMEYIFAALALTVGGALLAEAITRDVGK